MKRIFVEKKQEFRVENYELLNKIKNWLKITISDLRIINVYDIDNLDEETFNKSLTGIFAEPNTDDIYREMDLSNCTYFAIKNLAAQFDIRASSAEQCIKLINPNSNPKIWTSKLFIFSDDLNTKDLNKIKEMLINKVESEEKDLSVFGDKITSNHSLVNSIVGFIKYSKNELINMSNTSALEYEDLKCIQDYFKNSEKRDPTETEIKVLETYWSDHCRHTTFETEIKEIKIVDQPLKKDIEESLLFFQKLKKEYRNNKPVTLMNIATIMTKFLKDKGIYSDVEVSEEINACGVFVDAKINDKNEKWLVQFKNETHNHPTEIEPFGGAATCLGGAIRDPLSGRSYVYQGMRISGSANPLEDIEKTIKHKLPQRKISEISAHGFSSYGNQIGLATAFVKELVHPGFKAKHLEAGMVVGASPASNVVRIAPCENDLVILLGGKTGRDGIGGATGSSKQHDEDSTTTSTAEVQKGNPSEERKIQRLFRNPNLTKLIKKSNDFGAGGVSVAIGEIADSLEINLDDIPLKYHGLNGTEIAISESQERMAILINPKNLELVQKFCKEENVEATVVAKVTNSKRLIIKWSGQEIVNLSRKFLDTNGAKRIVSATIDIQKEYKKTIQGNSIREQLAINLANLNVASQKGLQQQFDSTIGNSTVLNPYGGIAQLTPTQVSVQKLPVRKGYTDTATMISYGYDPFLSEQSPYLGGMNAVVESLAKIVAAGGRMNSTKLSFQEYYERLNLDPIKWGKPLASLLGTLDVMKEFNIAAIGGKDSMSGTFKNINVPPTLISFALSVVDANNVISPEFKTSGNKIYYFGHKIASNGKPNLKEISSNFKKIEKYIQDKKIVSAMAIESGGLSAALAKMSFGNYLGFNIETDINLFSHRYGAIVVEATEELDALLIGKVSHGWKINEVPINNLTMMDIWSKQYELLYPLSKGLTNKVITSNIKKIIKKTRTNKWLTTKNPQVLIPVFPGTNCEYDIEKKFINAGAECKQIVFCNNTEDLIKKSINTFAKEVEKTSILVLAGGFSASDEPDGSGKFITSILKNEIIKKAINNLILRGGYILGICNGFQALIKSGLLPYGEIKELNSSSPTLVRNNSNLHVAKYVYTKTCSINSPWLNGFKLNEIHSIPISHGEGRFAVNNEELNSLISNDQIAFQYTDKDGMVTANNINNPNGSTFAIEGIVSRDGQILGKMGHSERYEKNIAKNIFGNKNQDIFKNIIDYIKGEI